MHPSFPDPFQTSANRDKAFELTASGWGGFTILITVHYTDGKEAKTSYFLDLQKTDRPQMTMELTLATIEVEWDGSTGSTGWAFEVFVDGKSLFKLPNRKYDDGRESASKNNLYLADTDGSPVRPVTVTRGQPLHIEIRGRRSFPPFLGDVVYGAGNLDSGDGALIIHVSNQKPQDGSFVFSVIARAKQAS